MLAGPINPNPFPPCGFSQRPTTKGKEGWIVARIRTIKPEFFTSADIASLTPLSRLFYVSMWCEADREGRIAWNPKTFKLRYFPADDCDIEQVAKEVVDAGLINLYEVDGKQYGEIPSFSQHQVINNRETESCLPENPRVKDASTRVQVEGRKEGRKGRERKGKEGASQEERDIAKQAIDFLNLKANRRYEHTDSNLAFVIARLRDGKTLQDLKTVIARKCRDWIGNPEMEQYLRPETLFNATKFSSYFGQCVEVPE